MAFGQTLANDDHLEIHKALNPRFLNDLCSNPEETSESIDFVPSEISEDYVGLLNEESFEQIVRDNFLKEDKEATKANAFSQEDDKNEIYKALSPRLLNDICSKPEEPSVVPESIDFVSLNEESFEQIVKDNFVKENKETTKDNKSELHKALNPRLLNDLCSNPEEPSESIDFVPSETSDNNVCLSNEESFEQIVQDNKATDEPSVVVESTDTVSFETNEDALCLPSEESFEQIVHATFFREDKETTGANAYSQEDDNEKNSEKLEPFVDKSEKHTSPILSEAEHSDKKPFKCRSGCEVSFAEMRHRKLHELRVHKSNHGEDDEPKKVAKVKKPKKLKIPKTKKPKKIKIAKIKKNVLGDENKKHVAKMSNNLEVQHKMCNMCDLTFQRTAPLMKHVTNCHGPKPGPTCNICGEAFQTIEKKNSHKKAKHTSTGHWAKKAKVCPHCGQKFLSLKNHIENFHTESEPLTCEQCGGMFKNKGKLKMHIRKHYWVNEAEQNCTCNMEFRGKQAMMEHYKIVHLNFERCLKCDSVVKDADERIHTCKNKLPKQEGIKKTLCLECGIELPTTLFEKHTRVAHDTTILQCEICQKNLSGVHSKLFHIKLAHKGTKMPCHLCGKELAQIVSHMRNSHFNKEVFKCEHCGKGFMWKGKLELHLNTHLKLKPFKCRMGCDVGFAESGNRRQHEDRVHKGKTRILT